MLDNMVPVPGTDDFLPAGACEEPECQGDHWGPHCDKPCPTNCKQSHIPTCLRESGHCIQCDGHLWWGGQCEKPAPEGCRTKSGRRPKGVDQRTGLCELGCKDGHFGERCEHKCSVNCVDGTCGENGICSKGCALGYWGDSCDRECPKFTNAASGCDRQTGMPVECDRGYYPGYHHNATQENDGEGEASVFLDLEQLGDPGGQPECMKCSDTCKTDGSNAICDKKGRCDQGCVKGFHGPQCKEQCPPRCAGPCDQMATNKWDGYCTTCHAGFSGDSCSEPCNSSCYTCDKNDKHRCTSCRYEEPVELNQESGTCSCIAGATRGSKQRCYCEKPGHGKTAVLDLAPVKACREECESHLEKVFGLGSSRCITKSLYNAVVKGSVRGKLEQGSCNGDEYQIHIEGGRHECLHHDFVQYIISE